MGKPSSVWPSVHSSTAPSWATCGNGARKRSKTACRGSMLVCYRDGGSLAPLIDPLTFAAVKAIPEA